MSITEPSKILTPWASTGSKNPIPQNSNNATGAAGYDKGFPDITMTPPEAGGIPPAGQDFNGIFYEVTNILRYMQAGGQPTFDAALATAIGGYPKGAMVLGSDGVTLWQSQIESNSTDPNTDPSDWGTFDIGLKADLAEPGGSDIVGFQQAGAGSTPRTSQDKMREWVSVKDFGAEGDGVADDTAAIQDALNSGATKVELSAGTYNTTAPIVIPSGISFVGEGQRLSKIKKNHAGDGVILTNALAYNGLEIGGFSVYAVAPHKQTGTGIKLTQVVRTTFKDINVSDCAYGLSMLTCYANSSNNLTIDRCGVGLSIQTSNHNKFNVTTIISDTGFIGVEMIGTSYSNNFDTLDVEYALYPLWLKSGTTSVTFTNYYAEFNTKGARLDAGVRAILFNTVFNSSVEMFDTATFAATDVKVNNLLDNFPTGVGGVSIGGSIGSPGISTTQNDVLFQHGALSAAYDFSDFSKFGLNAGSHFEWTGEPRKNYINAQDLSSGAQWVGTGTVTAVGSPTIGGVTAYRFEAGAVRTHIVTTDTAMAGRTFTVCVLVSGVAGGKFDLRQTDNVTETQTRTYVIGASGKRYVFLTTSWGAGSTGPNIGFTIANTGSTTLDFALPCIWEAPGPMPLTTRTRNHDGYTNYPIVTFQNFGETVKVFGSVAPTTGSWKVGDVALNTAPAASGNIGWVCTTAGSPGTWKTFGAIVA